jgi:hypothetical protein
VHLLVNFGGRVGVEQVVPVHVVLRHEEEQSEGRDERTGDTKHHCHAEDHHEARVLLAKAELSLDALADGGGVGLGLGPADSDGVHEEIGKAQQIEAGAHERGRDDVVDEEGSRIGQKDALPSVTKVD